MSDDDTKRITIPPKKDGPDGLYVTGGINTIEGNEPFFDSQITLDRAYPDDESKTITVKDSSGSIIKALVGLNGMDDIMFLLDADFLRAMNENMELGNQKDNREPNDWKELNEREDQDRLDAIFRHYDKYRDTNNSSHLVAVACNAMICWWHEQNRDGE